MPSTNVDNNVYDSVFKTMLNKLPELMVPLVNESFGRDYPEDTPVVPYRDEYQTPKGTRVVDSVFRLDRRLYHIECQSTSDSTMVVRMIEYDFTVALNDALASGKPYVMQFPSSCVLYLRDPSSMPDVLSMEVRLADGASFEYRVPVIKAQDYTSERIFSRRLLVLLPFYLMRYENAIAKIESDEERVRGLLEDCRSIRSQFEALTVKTGKTFLYEELMGLIIRVTEHMFRGSEGLQREVRNAMGGEVLELLHERAARLEREALEEGRKLGRKQGLEQGLERGLERGLKQGAEQAIETMSAELISMGVDEECVARVVAAARATHECSGHAAGDVGD